MARIGVNALYLIPGGVGGTEIYLRSLLAALAKVDSTNEYWVFTNRETGRDLVPEQANFRWKPQPVRAAIRPWRLLWEQTGLVWAARGVDVLFNPGFTAPALGLCPSVTVFHDLQHKRLPQYFRWFDLPFWNLFLWMAVRRSRALIAVSEATRHDLQLYYGRDATVVLHGVDPAFLEISAARSPQDYILCVSTLHPHKNLERLLQVYANTPELPQLVIAGMKGFAAKRIEELAGDHVRITGWIPRQELYGLFQRACAFVYPSTFEGFGIPVLEAMAAGIPVACSDIPPLREVAGDTVIYFDPEDNVAIGNALRTVITDHSRVEAARRRAQTFTWEKCARETLTVLLSQI
jgi:glycosyltransferase involved in cell wall biosynthesis